MSTNRDPKTPAMPSRVSLADGVYEILLSRLVDGTSPAGSALDIDALARDLSVSQTPIREAPARLEATGLVRRAALKGDRVAPLFTDRELSDLMDARAVIEPASSTGTAKPTNGFTTSSPSTPRFCMRSRSDIRMSPEPLWPSTSRTSSSARTTTVSPWPTATRGSSGLNTRAERALDRRSLIE